MGGVLLLGLGACQSVENGVLVVDGGSGDAEDGPDRADGSLTIDGGTEGPAPGGDVCSPDTVEGAFVCVASDACRAEPTCCVASGRCCAGPGAAVSLDLSACTAGWSAPGCELSPYGTPAPQLLEEGSSPLWVPGGGSETESGARWETEPLRIGPEGHELKVTFRPGSCPEGVLCVQQAGLLLIPEQGEALAGGVTLDVARLALLLGGDGKLRLLGPAGPVAETAAPAGGEDLEIVLRIGPDGAVEWTPPAGSGEGASVRTATGLLLAPGSYEVHLYGRSVQGEATGRSPAIRDLSLTRFGCDAPSGWGPVASLRVGAERLDVARGPEGLAMVRLVDEGGRTVVVLDRLEALDASGVREDARLQLEGSVRDVALEGDASGWTLWLLAADGSVRSVRGASLGALAEAEPSIERLDLRDGFAPRALTVLADEESELLMLLGEDAAGEVSVMRWKRAVGVDDWDFVDTDSMAQLGIVGRVVDVEMLRDAALWRLWVVLERGTRAEVVSFVTGPDMKVGDSVAAMATGARWKGEAAAGVLRVDGPAAWFSGNGAERALLLAARRFDGVDGEVVVRARPAPEEASAW